MRNGTDAEIEVARLRDFIASERRIAESQIQLFATRLGPDDALTREAERRYERLGEAIRHKVDPMP